MNYKDTLNLPQTQFPMKGNLTQREPQWAQDWDKENRYGKILESHKGAPKYILHDGPPYANGDIHMGHAFNKILKDIIVKFKTLQGYYVPYVPGWDCHGLPVEHALFKALGKTKDQVDQVEFRKKAHDYALKYVALQRDQFKRLGIFSDWENPYLTLNHDYEAEIIRSFIGLYRKGYIYKGLKPIYWCFDCETALAEAEVEYDEHESPSIYVAFPIENGMDKIFPNQNDVSALIWTTTPWTLPANLALSVHPTAEYVLVDTGEKKYLLAKDLVDQVFEKVGWKKREILGKCQGKDLEGLETLHPFNDRQSKFLLGEHVTLDTGTGIVHTAPGHGQEDYEIGLKYKLDVYSPVDHKGCFDKTVPLFEGQNVFKANGPIIELLIKVGALVFQEKVSHSYPHCWRCKNPLIFRATHQWFASMEKHDLRKKTLKEIKKVKWVPKIAENRIGAMVQGRPDWCLSRQRLWGVPIPIFSCSECQEVLLTEEIGKRIVEVIRQHGSNSWFTSPIETFISNGTTCSQCGSQKFEKENDIIDVWFDSGVSHQAVLRQREELQYPADLYLEGSDQHRGWFQSALLTAVGLEGSAPYKQVLTHGFVLDGEGKKMSKSLGNVISPKDAMKKYGADILRLWVSSVDYTTDVRISNEILDQNAEAYRKIRNTFKFLLGNLFDYDPEKDKVPMEELHELDRWALSNVATLCEDVTRLFDEHEFCKGYRALHQFCTVTMSAFYFDILKDRLYTFGKKSIERRSSQTVLAEILNILVRLFAPILVFTTDEVLKSFPEALKQKGGVHEAEWPKVPKSWLDPKLNQRWLDFFNIREAVLVCLEEARKSKLIGNALEAKVVLYSPEPKWQSLLKKQESFFSTLFIVSAVALSDKKLEGMRESKNGMFHTLVERAPGEKCGRCWKFRTSVGAVAEHPTLCQECEAVVESIKQ